MIKKIFFTSMFLLSINLVNSQSCEDALNASMGAVDNEYFSDRHYCNYLLGLSIAERIVCNYEAELSWDQNTANAIDTYNNC